MVATLKQILSSQKKTDYKPEEPATAEVTQVSCTIVLLVLFIVCVQFVLVYYQYRCAIVVFTSIVHWLLMYNCSCSCLFFQTCTKAVGYVEECTNVIKLSLDGKNQEVVLLEFGIRVHRVIYEMILTFTVNSSGKTRVREERTHLCFFITLGAMFLICDLNEYRKAVKEFKVSSAIMSE